MFDNKLGERLKQARINAGKTQEQVATMLGVTRGAYSHLENNRNEPDNDTLVKLASYFEVTTDYLLGKNQTPEWAKKDEVIQLDKILQSKVGMAYGPDGEISEEDREALDNLIAGYFWSKKKKEKKRSE